MDDYTSKMRLQFHMWIAHGVDGRDWSKARLQREHGRIRAELHIECGGWRA